MIRDESFTQKSFPCQSCGASLIFSADENALKCEYCGRVNPLYPPRLPVVEHDLDTALARIEKAPRYDLTQPREIQCPVCAGKFSLEPRIRSTRCPYCDSPIVTNMDIFMPLAPESLLPFQINQKEAKEIFKKWVGSLWFAPSSLSKYADAESRFEGIYLPYWTYDAQTITHFQGYRGDTYYERVRRHVYINGREEIVEEMVPRIEWTPVQGEIENFFDDILIGATKTLPRRLADALGPWDLENLLPYDERYLSGFESETYAVALDEGFAYAKEFISFQLQSAVRRRIGGDHQKISYMQIYHTQKRFKYILLPIWTASFEFRGKTYRFAINARNGNIQGERPYSSVKIVISVLGILLLLAILFFLSENPDMLQRVPDFVKNIG